MRNGLSIAKFMQENADTITGMNINGDPKNGFVEFKLLDESTHKFDWDEEDQAYFQCVLDGTEWKPGMKGLTSLKIRSHATALDVSVDRPVAINVNGQPLHEWGTKSETTHGMWKKKGDTQQRRTNNHSNHNDSSSGWKKGWFGKM